MKHLTLAICVTFSIYAGTVFGQDEAKNFLPEKLKKIEYKVKMHDPLDSSAEAIGKTPELPDWPDAKKASLYYSVDKNGLFDDVSLRNISGMSLKQQIDSCVTVNHSTGDSIQIETFKFYDNGQPCTYRIYRYDMMKRKWILTTENTFEWDENGLCTSQDSRNPQYGSGSKQSYKYDDRGLGIEMITYNYKDGEWIPLAKGEYGYDENGRMNEERTFSMTDTKWIPVTYTKVAYDEWNHQLMFEKYQWKNNQWVGIAERVLNEWTADGNITKIFKCTWDKEANKWKNGLLFTQGFNENNLCTYQKTLFWNDEYNSWEGCRLESWGEVTYNKFATLEYDEKNRLVSNVAYRQYTVAGEWTRVGVEKTDYFPNGKGGEKSICQMFLIDHNDPEKITLKSVLESEFDKNGYLVWQLEKLDFGGKVFNYKESEFTCNEKGEVTEYKMWNFTTDDENKKLAASWNEYDINDHGVVTEFRNKMGQNTGPDDWVNSIKWVYNLDQDTIVLDQLQYRWTDEEWTPSQGTGFRFDYNVPVNDIRWWVGPRPYHKITEQRRYKAVGRKWDYDVMKYIYKDMQTSSVKDVTTADEQNTDGNVYDIQGRIVGTAKMGELDRLCLPKGIYIINGKKIVQK